MSDKKIDLFKDSEYESFDWLNRAIEPLLFTFADKFANIPSQIEIKLIDALRMATNGWSKEISIPAVLSYVVRSNLDSRDMDLVKDHFTLEMDEPELIIDLRDIPKDKNIRFIKKVEALPEEFQRQVAALKVGRILNNYTNRADLSRINEVMDVLGCEENRRSRSVGYKLQTIATTFSKIIMEDKWRIRNLDLAIKAAGWMMHYMADGNMASFQNFVKMKCMTHSGNPIYSIQETI